MQKNLAILFAFAIFVLVLGLAITPTMIARISNATSARISARRNSRAVARV